MLQEDNRVGNTGPNQRPRGTGWKELTACNYYDSDPWPMNCGEIKGPQWGVLEDSQPYTVPSHSLPSYLLSRSLVLWKLLNLAILGMPEVP